MSKKQAILVFDDDMTISHPSELENNGVIVIVPAGLSDEEIYEILMETDVWENFSDFGWTPISADLVEA